MSRRGASICCVVPAAAVAIGTSGAAVAAGAGGDNGVVTGTVMADGAPVANARVTVHQQNLFFFAETRSDADVVVFDPDAIRDHATLAKPHQYGPGVVHVFVNGEQVLRDGEHTGATPGTVVRRRGWRGALTSHVPTSDHQP